MVCVRTFLEDMEEVTTKKQKTVYRPVEKLKKKISEILNRAKAYGGGGRESEVLDLTTADVTFVKMKRKRKH